MIDKAAAEPKREIPGELQVLRSARSLTPPALSAMDGRAGYFSKTT
jgi:hypothetical protein